MTKLEDALRDLTYSSVASAILLELYTHRQVRSSVLVKAIENKLSCSRTLIYHTLSEIRKKELIYLPTERKRMKFYALTKLGRNLLEEEISKNVAEVREFAKGIPRPDITGLELLADEVFNELPSNLRRPEIRMLIRRKLDKNVKDLKGELTRRK